MRSLKSCPAWTLAIVAALALAATIPVWIARYLPIEDLPVHVAALRVVHSLHDPRFGLEEHFVLTLGRTQYVSYYLTGSLLASVFGVLDANRLMISAYIAGTPLALAYFLHALGRDRRLALFAVPLVYNPLFMLGLFPFLLGVPVMFLALGTLVHYAKARTWTRGALLAAIATFLFYSHVIPFLIFGVGIVALFPWSRRREWAAAAAPFGPVTFAAASWLFATDGGRQVLDTVAGQGTARPSTLPTALRELYLWTGDAFRDGADETIFAAFAATVGFAFFAARRESTASDTSTIRRRYLVVPAVCALVYLLGERDHGFIWPLAQRFAILAAFTSIPLLAFPEGRAGHAALGATVLVCAASIANVGVHFVRFEREEVDHFDRILDRMEPRRRVAALIFDSASTLARWHPFLHFASYYQAEKGGIVQFSFAGYNHWPFDYRPGQYPPPGGPARPRWEWSPGDVATSDELLAPYYDYVIERGPGFEPPDGTFRVALREGRWTLWEGVVPTRSPPASEVHDTQEPDGGAHHERADHAPP